MPSYISFTNKTTYPVISVYSDEELVADAVTKGTKTKLFATNSGTVEFTVREHLEKNLYSVWIPLYPNKSYNLIIKNNTAYIQK